ncbi:MAG: hypothetical protein J3Q66DRAFT_404200 [Benniella sp.]|nr:MAG: hypothetical protein J3Q66DRAFT_404200 [Benniella sp.]
MVGRSLFSLLAIAAVTIQSCAASFIDEGIYRIQVSDNAPLSVLDVSLGVPVLVYNEGQYQEWELRASGDGEPDVFEIVLPRSPFYVAPARQPPFVELSLQRYRWRIQSSGGDRYIIERLVTCSRGSLPARDQKPMRPKETLKELVLPPIGSEAMIGRSLFSLLAIAAVAIQLCAANLIPNGVYSIVLSDLGPLSVNDADKGARVYISKDTEIQEWDIRTVNGHDLVEIILYSSIGPLYVAPAEGSPYATLREDPYHWRVQPKHDQVVFERTDINEAVPWVLSVSPFRSSPRRAGTLPLGKSKDPQAWSLISADKFKQEDRNHCGPRRLSKNSFYRQ